MNTFITSLPLVYINILLAWALWFPVSAGQLSMAVPAFTAVGAYSSSLFSIHQGTGLAWGMVIGAVFGAFAGLPFGLLCTRLRVFGLAVASLGAVEILVTVAQNVSYVGGSVGLIGIATSSIAWPGFIACLAVIAFSVLVFRSRLGRALDMLRHDERLAASVGVSPLQVKLFVLVVSGLVAGIGGSLYAAYTGFIDPSQFSSELIVELFAYVMLGGANSFWGPVAGAAVLTIALQYLAVAGSIRYILFAALLIAVIIVRRDGIISRSARLRRRRLSRAIAPNWQPPDIGGNS
jgi:branched-chain amino acid transport system permease protein